MMNFYLFFKRALLLVIALALFTDLFAQERAVSGKVTEDGGVAIPGVNILVKGTTKGTVTDIDGNYRIDVEEGATLVFSAIGYTTEEIEVGTRGVIDVNMVQDIRALSEVVVTGYTEQRERDITGAVTVIDAASMNEIRAPNIGQKLAGRATGVTTSTSGAPGEGANIRIRGISSISGNNDPLIIIDGVQIQGDKALNGLNPNDIESMQVLKDASAAAIYGSRASAGVIVITTKQGKAGKTRLTYDGYAGVQSPVGGYNDFLIRDPRDYAKIHMITNPNLIPFYGGDPANPQIPKYFFPTSSVNNQIFPRQDTNPDGDFYIDPSTYSWPGNMIMLSNQQGTDWWDEVFNPALITEHHIGLSGGSDKALFNTSAGYFRQDGTMMHTYFERFSTRVNSRFTVGKLTIGESLSVARSEQVNQRNGSQNEQNTIMQTMIMPPIVPVYDLGGQTGLVDPANTGRGYGGARTSGFSNAKNPVAYQELGRNNIDVDYRILANVFGEYAFTDWLKLRTSYSGDYRNVFQPRFFYERYEDNEPNSNNNYNETDQRFFNWTFTNTLEFNKNFADLHNVKVLLGQEAVRNQFRQINGSIDNLAFRDPGVRYLNLAYSTFNNVGSQERISKVASLFTQVNYEFNDRYLASFTIRRDGSSDFRPDQRYGVFPSASLGWRLSSENFMQGVTFLDDLKLRGGWGITGNQFIPRAYNSFDQWGGRTPTDAGYNISGDGGGMARGFARYRYGDPFTRWEETETINVGFDASLLVLGGNIGVTFDVYQRDITDLIYDANLFGAAGNAAPAFRNVAAMRNNGWDLGVSYRGNITSDLGFNVNANLSHYKNEIRTLDGEQDFIFPQGGGSRFGNINIWKIGSPLSSFYGFQNDGFFTSVDEINELNAAAVAASDDPSVTEYQTGAGVGRFKRKDINGDGRINDDDQGIIGSPHPDLTIGLNLGLSYKRFDMSMFLFASLGNQTYNYIKVFSHLGQYNSNRHVDVLSNSWSESNPNATLPAIDPNDNLRTQSSDFYVEDGSYLRAQNLTLGYTFPTISGLGMESLRVYVQGQNFLTFTKYSGIDPAVSNVNIGQNIDGRNQNDGWSGYDFGNYPAAKSFMIGVNATF